MQIRLERSKVATNVIDTEVQFETREIATQRSEKCWLNLSQEGKSVQKRKTPTSHSTFEEGFNPSVTQLVLVKFEGLKRLKVFYKVHFTFSHFRKQ